MAILNWKLISHPLNWLIILLMLVIAGIFGHLLLTVLDQEPSGPSGTVNAAVPQGYAVNVAGH